MSFRSKRLKQAFFIIFVCAGVLCFSSNVWASTITGIVYDHRKNPLPDVDVELLDELYRSIDRTRTDMTGRYKFSVSDGNYTVKVMPFRYDLVDQTAYVEIRSLSVLALSTSSPRAGKEGNIYEVRDFYLQPKKGSLADVELGVVFAQEVPKEAEKAFEQAVKDLSKKRTDEGISGLKQAIKLFPDYYLALSELGRILAMKGEYGEAAPLLLKAAEINPKSPSTFFYLGLSLHKLNYNKAAITALTNAHTIAPSSALVLLTLGSAERQEGKYEDAEKHLLMAKKLAPQDVPDIHWELAQLYGLNMKRYKEAAEELEKYLKAGKYSEDQVKKVKRLIADFQEKAKSQDGKS
jgi:tetratricopeptide (TPR) repeat protein